MVAKFKLNTDRYKAFLQNHLAITRAVIERDAGVPKNLIKAWMADKQKLDKEQYLKLLFTTSKYSSDPWMFKEAWRLYSEMNDSGELKNVKFKFKL